MFPVYDPSVLLFLLHSTYSLLVIRAGIDEQGLYSAKNFVLEIGFRGHFFSLKGPVIVCLAECFSDCQSD